MASMNFAIPINSIMDNSCNWTGTTGNPFISTTNAPNNANSGTSIQVFAKLAAPNNKNFFLAIGGNSGTLADGGVLLWHSDKGNVFDCFRFLPNGLGLPRDITYGSSLPAASDSFEGQIFFKVV